MRLCSARLCWVPVLALAAGASATVIVPVEIDMRAQIDAGHFDPAHDAVGVRGSLPPLSWNRALAARPVGAGRYAVELRFERVPFGGQPVQYKFRIERPDQGLDDGWEQGRNRLMFLDAPSPRVVRAFNAEPEPVSLRRAGTIERLGAIASAHVLARDVQVWLPPGYAQRAGHRYPVLYLHDGQNVFDAAAAGAEWQVDETAQRLVEAGAIEPPIIVAVDSGRDRDLDYTPTQTLRRDERATLQKRGGGVANYARFLAEELKPLIDRRYRTRTDAASTAIGGSSLGGLASLWLALHRADTFGAALVVSPAVWWDDEYAMRDIRHWSATPAGRPRLWVSMGALDDADALPEARRLHDALRARGWTDTTLTYVETPDGHDEASWAAHVEDMLRFLYGRPPAAR